jgi:hypothetical protein
LWSVAGKQAAAAVCVALALGLRRPLQWRCCCPRSLALVVRRQPRRRQAQPVVVAALGGGAQGQGWRRVASCQRRRVCLCYCAVFGSAMVSACSARGQLPPAPLASAPTTTRLPRHGAENAATHAPPSEASCACDAAPRPRCVSSPCRCHHSWAAVRTSAAATPRTVKIRAAKSAFKRHSLSWWQPTCWCKCGQRHSAPTLAWQHSSSDVADDGRGGRSPTRKNLGSRFGPLWERRVAVVDPCTLQPDSLSAKKMFDRPPERPCMQLLSACRGSARRRPPRCNDGPATPRVVRWG